MNNYAEDVKARVPLLDLLAFYGFHPVFNRMPCPFHSGKDRNMLVSNNFYKCFVCGEHGDVITFVRRYFGLSFPDAISKINDDFRLGLPIGRTLSAQEQAEADARYAKLQHVAQLKRLQRESLERKYREAFDKYAACEVILSRSVPLSPTSGFTDLFCEAMKNIDGAWEELKHAEALLFEFNHPDRRSKAFGEMP